MEVWVGWRERREVLSTGRAYPAGESGDEMERRREWRRGGSGSRREGEEPIHEWLERGELGDMRCAQDEDLNQDDRSRGHLLIELAFLLNRDGAPPVP